MYAVVRTGGKQYKVARDDIIKVERLTGEVGEVITLGEVLMIGGADTETALGAPLIDGASVRARIVEQARTKKIIVFKKRRRQNYRRRKGHRQHQTILQIDDVLMAGARATGKPATGKPATGAPGTGTPRGMAAKKAAPTAEAPQNEPSQKQQPAAPEAAPVAQMSPMMYETAPEQRDDLKVISGVGPKLEEKLNELGVYTYAQIAGWTPENVAFVDEHLSFKGRIERDDWVGKAGELEAAKTEAPDEG